MANILVTGASRGIGYELVKQLCANGHTVLALSRKTASLAELEQECKAAPMPGKIRILACDLEDPTQVKQAGETIKKELKHLDVLINNAGALINKPFAQLLAEDLEKAYRVNVFSVVQLLQEVLSLLGSEGRSHVVNISSMGGFQGSVKFAGLSAYSSSKAALACLTECLAEEFKEKNIAFNCLALGAVQTEMLEEAFPGYMAPVSAEKMAKYIADFAISAHNVLNGKVLPVSLSTP